MVPCVGTDYRPTVVRWNAPLGAHPMCELVYQHGARVVGELRSAAAAPTARLYCVTIWPMKDGKICVPSSEIKEKIPHRRLKC